MKKVVALCSSLIALTALPSTADQQQVFEQMQKGKEAFDKSCTACHDRSQAEEGDRDSAAWTALVDDMIEQGAEVGEDSKEALAGFLAAGSLLRSKCSVCHSPQRPLSKNKDLAGWEKTVKRMSGKRPGHLSELDVAQITGYLAAARPLK